MKEIIIYKARLVTKVLKVLTNHNNYDIPTVQEPKTDFLQKQSVGDSFWL